MIIKRKYADVDTAWAPWKREFAWFPCWNNKVIVWLDWIEVRRRRNDYNGTLMTEARLLSGERLGEAR